MLTIKQHEVISAINEEIRQLYDDYIHSSAYALFEEYVKSEIQKITDAIRKAESNIYYVYGESVDIHFEKFVEYCQLYSLLINEIGSDLFFYTKPDLEYPDLKYADDTEEDYDLGL